MDFNTFLHSLLDILNEMSPYILLGFLIAGLLHEFVKPQTMSRHLAGKGWKPVLKAAALGVPLPLCSCGVLPTAVGLHRQGASKGATTSFLISTPQTGVDSIAATYSLLGLPMAIIRPIAALLGGFIGGISVSAFDKEGTPADKAEVAACPDGSCAIAADEAEPKAPIGTRLLRAVRYGMVDMVANVGKWLVIGLVVAALITVFVPDEFLVSLSNRPILAMLAMIVIAVPMYVCATGSIPIALSLMLKGLNPGAAFVLLMAGPAANFASVMVLGRAIGRRATAIYLASVIATALLFGIIVDYMLPGEWMRAGAASATHGVSCHHEVSWFASACTVVLLGALAYSFWWMRRHGHTHSHSITNNQNEKDMTPQLHTRNFHITGMACNHCRSAVERAIAAIPGVTEVNVDLGKATATVTGDFDAEAIVRAVTLAGFEVK